MTIAVYKAAQDRIDEAERELHRFAWEGLQLVMKVINEAEIEAHKLAGWALHPHETIKVPDMLPPVDAAPVDTAANPFKKA